MNPTAHQCREIVCRHLSSRAAGFAFDLTRISWRRLKSCWSCTMGKIWTPIRTCSFSDLEGIKGLVSGKSNLTSVDSTITCNKAMTCILAPGGEACRSVAQSAKTIKYINTETTTDGREVLSCLDDGSCEFASSECVKSDILESCYVMWVGPTPLFDQPIALIKGAEVTPNEEGNIAISPASGATIRNSWLAVLSAAFACFM
jgi:hypothetical protein